MDRVLPPHLKRKPSDTTVATEMGRCLAVKGKTTCESAGNTRPSKHELTYGIRYRHIQIHAPPPPQANTQVTARSTTRWRNAAEKCTILYT